jgi:hypothetical protein
MSRWMAGSLVIRHRMKKALKADPKGQKFSKTRTYFCTSVPAAGIFDNYFR